MAGGVFFLVGLGFCATVGYSRRLPQKPTFPPVGEESPSAVTPAEAKLPWNPLSSEGQNLPSAKTPSFGGSSPASPGGVYSPELSGEGPRWFWRHPLGPNLGTPGNLWRFWENSGSFHQVLLVAGFLGTLVLLWELTHFDRTKPSPPPGNPAAAPTLGEKTQGSFTETSAKLTPGKGSKAALASAAWDLPDWEEVKVVSASAAWDLPDWEEVEAPIRGCTSKVVTSDCKSSPEIPTVLLIQPNPLGEAFPHADPWAAFIPLKPLGLLPSDLRELSRQDLDIENQLTDLQLGQLVTRLVFAFRYWPQLQQNQTVRVDLLEPWADRRPVVLRLLLRAGVKAAYPPALHRVPADPTVNQLPLSLLLMPKKLLQLDGSVGWELENLYDHQFPTDPQKAPGFFEQRLRSSGY